MAIDAFRAYTFSIRQRLVGLEHPPPSISLRDPSIIIAGELKKATNRLCIILLSLVSMLSIVAKSMGGGASSYIESHLVMLHTIIHTRYLQCGGSWCILLWPAACFALGVVGSELFRGFVEYYFYRVEVFVH